ncbi:hypothetical protein NFI96_006292 [Prochilodus magdalenae]|nr:hypothetical protein NFI96_006292 [Prochilodus magdalenae]
MGMPVDSQVLYGGIVPCLESLLMNPLSIAHPFTERCCRCDQFGSSLVRTVLSFWLGCFGNSFRIAEVGTGWQVFRENVRANIKLTLTSVATVQDTDGKWQQLNCALQKLTAASGISSFSRLCGLPSWSVERFLLYNIRRMRPFLSQKATQLLVQSLVISRLDDCSLLLAGLPPRAIRLLQLVQNAAARLMFNLPKFTHVTPLLRSLHWLLVVARITFKTLTPAYKAKNGPAPAYLMA